MPSYSFHHHHRPTDQHQQSSPPGSSSSTVPIAELVREAPRIDRCVYFSPPTANGKKGTKTAEEEVPIGLRRFFFGDSPRPRRISSRPGADQTSPLSAVRAGRSMLANRQPPHNNSNAFFFNGLPPASHSSRTVSVDFDSESSGGTTPAPTEDVSGRNKERPKPQQNIRRMEQQQKQRMMVDQSPMGTTQRHYYQQNGGNTNGGGHGQQQQQTFNGGAQFDTQSMHSRRSRSFSTAHNNSDGPIPHNHQSHHSHQHKHQMSSSSPPHHSSASAAVRCGSCSNLSVLNGGSANGGALVLYDGGANSRHSMALAMDGGGGGHQQMPPPPGPFMCPPAFLPTPPPPFYYTAATLPHPPPPPMDLATFRRAMKETERFEKKQQKMMSGGDYADGLGGVCWEFCCGGSALILWLVVTLIALGFLGFLLLAIYLL